MGLDCRVGVSPYPVGSGMSMVVDPAYAATLGSSSAFAWHALHVLSIFLCILSDM